MSRNEVLVERNGPVTAVIINRPETRNACQVHSSERATPVALIS